MKLITLTLNPAFDIHCHTPHFEPFHENLADITERDAGGKGVNISRALCAVDRENLALVVLGEENGENFAACLKKDGLLLLPITVAGRIRENITLHTDDQDETRISFRGFSAPEGLLDSVYDAIEAMLDGECIVTLTGSLPSGMSMSSVKAFLEKLSKKGVRVVIDSRSFGLSDLIEAKPWLIKPNEEEIAVYLGRDPEGIDAIVEAAERLQRGGIDNVMISLGGRGALLVSHEGRFMAEPPKIAALSTIGAGDSSIAGFLHAAANGENSESCLGSAVSFGTAACMTSGTKPPRAEDIADIRKRVKTKRI